MTHVLAFPATRDGFAGAFAALRSVLNGHALGQTARYGSEVVFEEIVTNILKHAYSDSDDHTIELALDVAERAIVMRIEDDGVPFDPTSLRRVETTRSLSEASVGGRGLSLVRRYARSLEYERTPTNRNRLTVTIDRWS